MLGIKSRALHMQNTCSTFTTELDFQPSIILVTGLFKPHLEGMERYYLREAILRTKKLTRQECHLRWMRQERYWQEQQPWACYLGAGLRLVLTAILHSSSFCTSFRFRSKCDSTRRASLRENTGHRNILAKYLPDTQSKHSEVAVTTCTHTEMMESRGRLIEPHKFRKT